MSATLDTLKLAKRFREAGASEQMAEAFAEGVPQNADQSVVAVWPFGRSRSRHVPAQ